MSPPILGYDFYHLWAAGRATLEGSDPYSVAAIKPIMATLGWQPDEVVFGFLHPPWTLWLFALFALLPFQLSLIIWLALTVVALIACLWWCLDKIQILAPNAALRSQDVIFAAICFPPFFSTLMRGQTNHLLILGVLLAVILLEGGSALAAGVVFSLALVKPQFVIGPGIILLVRYASGLRIKFALGVGLGLAIQALISMALFPSAFAAFNIALQSVGSAALMLPGASLRQAILPTGIDLGNWPFIICTGLSLVAALSRQIPNLSALGISVALACLGAPYAWPHSLLLLFPFYLTLLDGIWRRSSLAGTALVVGFAFIGVLDLLRPALLAAFFLLLPLAVLINSMWTQVSILKDMAPAK